MGCDIHMVLERRVGDHWLGVRTFDGFHMDDNSGWASPPATRRNYARFAALAGVRGEGPAARGLPDDASELSRYLFTTYGDHTPSWLPVQEAAQIFLRTDELVSALQDYVEKYPESFYFEVESDLDAHRLVFWFDS